MTTQVDAERTNLSVGDPKISEVLDTQTGEHLSVHRVIGENYEDVIQKRLAIKTFIKQSAPRYLCGTCYVPVYLCCRHDQRRFFFKHTVEDGSCPAITRGHLSQLEINARKYNGAKESALHRDMKQWLVESLVSSGKFTDIAPEKRWTGPITGEFRRPDVCATWQGLKIAFEVQLSTTFLDVIAERRLFYLQQGGLLFWVFARFDADQRRLTQDDVFFNNNRNAFIVSSSTRDASVAAGDFLLDCLWANPTAAGETASLQRKRISFSELTLEPQTQRAFYFNFDQEALRQVTQPESERCGLAADFEDWWLRIARENPSQYDQERVVDGFPENRPQSWEVPGPVAKFLPSSYWIGERLPVALLNVLYSAKHGRPVGLKRNLFIEVAHYAVEAHPTYLPWFRKAFSVYNRGELLQQQDKTGKWRHRVAAYKKEMKALPELYAPDRRHQELIELLFPELTPLP